MNEFRTYHQFSFYDPQSMYCNFVRLTKQGYAQRIITHERYRASFIDNELRLVIRDNLNGLATLNDVKKGVISKYIFLN